MADVPLPPVASVVAPWAFRERLAAVFFVVYLAIQIAVPIGKLWQPARPGRFGWQMFAGTEVKIRFVLILDNGTEKVVDPAQFQLARRLDLQLDEAFPPYLCAKATNGRAVRVEVPGKPPREVVCPR